MAEHGCLMRGPRPMRGKVAGQVLQAAGEAPELGQQSGQRCLEAMRRRRVPAQREGGRMQPRLQVAQVAGVAYEVAPEQVQPMLVEKVHGHDAGP